MLNNEKTIRFEDFAAVSQDGGDVLGKVLYYSLSSILIDRDELESLCDTVGRAGAIGLPWGTLFVPPPAIFTSAG